MYGIRKSKQMNIVNCTMIGEELFFWTTLLCYHIINSGRYSLDPDRRCEEADNDGTNTGIAGDRTGDG